MERKIKVANHRKMWTNDELMVIKEEHLKGCGYLERAAARLGRTIMAVAMISSRYNKCVRIKRKKSLQRDLLDPFLYTVALSNEPTFTKAVRKAADKFSLDIKTAHKIVAEAKRGIYD